MAKGQDKQKNEKKKGKTLKEKRAAKKEKNKYSKRHDLLAAKKGRLTTYIKINDNYLNILG